LTVADWVTDTLVGDSMPVTGLQALLGGSQASAAGRVWEGVAPEGTPYPFLTFTVGEIRVVGGVGLVEIMARIPLTLKAVTQGESYAPLVPLVNRAVALISGQANIPTVTPGIAGLVLTCERIGGIQYPERDGGIEYRHLGGLYEVLAQ
jgi:hypothetical protein